MSGNLTLQRWTKTMSIVDKIRELVYGYDAMSEILNDWKKEQDKRDRADIIEELVKQVVIVYPK